MNKFEFKEVSAKHVNGVDQWSQGFLTGVSVSVALAVAIT